MNPWALSNSWRKPSTFSAANVRKSSPKNRSKPAGHRPDLKNSRPVLTKLNLCASLPPPPTVQNMRPKTLNEWFKPARDRAHRRSFMWKLRCPREISLWKNPTPVNNKRLTPPVVNSRAASGSVAKQLAKCLSTQHLVTALLL